MIQQLTSCCPPQMRHVNSLRCRLIWMVLARPSNRRRSDNSAICSLTCLKRFSSYTEAGSTKAGPGHRWSRWPPRSPPVGNCAFIFNSLRSMYHHTLFSEWFLFIYFMIVVFGNIRIFNIFMFLKERLKYSSKTIVRECKRNSETYPLWTLQRWGGFFAFLYQW